MQLFYNPDITALLSTFTFSKEESRHIIKVLRKKTGDILHVTNGKGYLFEGAITDANIKKCRFKINKSILQPEKNYRLHLAVAPTKMNDRFEWFLEKATEIGVDIITPLLCDHSERKVIKHERFEKIIQSAMKQSLQAYLPKLNTLTPFKEFLKKDFEGQTFIAHCEEGEKKSLKDQLNPKGNVLILIGPEGDFSTNEIALALEKKITAVSLGRNRLRTETAAIAATHTTALVNQL